VREEGEEDMGREVEGRDGEEGETRGVEVCMHTAPCSHLTPRPIKNLSDPTRRRERQGPMADDRWLVPLSECGSPENCTHRRARYCP